jgi:hypothetical protein
MNVTLLCDAAEIQAFSLTRPAVRKSGSRTKTLVKNGVFNAGTKSK